jgi:dienelactone hydrolase
VREHPFQFGPELNLIGILTEPDTAAERRGLPIVLFLNAGLLHHVGPHRMSVELARRLAGRGIRSLRFDLGGRGDSETTRVTGSDEAQVLADVTEAMDFLERKYNVRRFVLFGLCAGADNAHATAVRDPRVVGAILLDGHGYWTRRSYIGHYLPRVFRPSAWLNYLRRSLGPPKQEIAEFGVHGQRRPFGPRWEVEQEIQALVDRGAQLLYFYTGGVSYYYNYAGQFRDMFSALRARGKIEVEHYPNADHTYTFAEDRERLLARVVDWCSSRTWTAG